MFETTSPAFPGVTKATPGTFQAQRSTQTGTWCAIIRGLGTGAVVGTALASMLGGYEQRLLPLPLNLALFAFLGFAFVFAGDGVFTLASKVLRSAFGRLHAERAVRALDVIPVAHIGRVLAMVVLLSGARLFPDTILGSIGLPPATQLVAVPITIAGALIAVGRMPGRGRSAQLVLGGAALVVPGLAAGWLLYPGTNDYLPEPSIAPAVASLALPDPGDPGSHTVDSLTYGSGTDRQRHEYAAGADLTTPTVDGAAIYAGFGGVGGAVAEWFWGFDNARLPINGRAWYPDGEGPFPLVLIVHGNHAMTDFSDAGYDYLGEHLASHGMIAVSADENFLNGYLLGDGNGQEMPLRAWLLLEHLQQWRTWNATPGNPFSGRVDLDRVALIGHSRGGEAAAHAALLNTGPYPPVTAVDGEFDFGIRGVVGIAPSDGQFRPNGGPLTLRDTSYLMLVGGHDADTNTAVGIPTFNRVRFEEDPDAFAATAYMYRANHGQFSTIWADRDHGLMDSMLLNRNAYLSGEDQRRSAKVVITAFLQSVLQMDDRYRDVFRAPELAAAWLPDDTLVTTYRDPSFKAMDTSTAVVPTGETDLAGAKVVATGFDLWQREQLLLRDGETPQGNRAVRLTWAAGAVPSFAVRLTDGAIAEWGPTAGDEVTFSLADAGEAQRPLEVWVELETTDGARARVPLSSFGTIHPPLPARILKADWVDPVLGFDEVSLHTPFERVLQTYVVPLAAFEEADPAFRIGEISVVRLVFAGPDGGSVFLDDVGFFDH